MMVPSSSLATWPPTNTKPPALVATERGSVRVLGLRSAKYSIVIVGASANNHAAASSTPPTLDSPAVSHAILQPSSCRAPFTCVRLWPTAAESLAISFGREPEADIQL